MEVFEDFSQGKRNPSAGALGFWGAQLMMLKSQQAGQIGAEHLAEDVGDRDRQDDGKQNSEHGNDELHQSGARIPPPL